MYNPGLDVLLGRVMETRAGRFVVACFAFVTATALLLVLGPVQVDQVRLACDPHPATGRVTASQTVPSDDLFSSDKWQIKYSFVVAGNAYVRTRPIGEAWSDLDKQSWTRAVSAGTIDVLYLPAEPSVNCPAVDGPGLWWWSIGTAFGLVVTATGAWWWMARVIRTTFLDGPGRTPVRR